MLVYDQIDCKTNDIERQLSFVFSANLEMLGC